MINIFDSIEFSHINSITIILWFVSCLFLSLYFFVLFKRVGKISISFVFVVLAYVIPFIIVGPFSFSSMNTLSVFCFDKFIDYNNDSFIITTVGFFSFCLTAIIACFVDPPALNKGSFLIRLFDSKRVDSFFICASLLFSLTIVILSLAIECYKNLRQFSMIHTQIRPLVNFLIDASSILSVFLAGIFFKNKKSIKLFLVFLFFLFSISIFATRSAFLTPFFSYFLVFLLYKKNISWIFCVFISIILIITALLFKIFLRSEGSISIDSFQSVAETFMKTVLVGNTFSDMRDFSWVLYGAKLYKTGFLYGKTLFAGVLGFIPSSWSEFREVWAWGRFSTRVAGLDSLMHPGLRPGAFGEWYINFGLPGVVFVGSIAGFICGYMDRVFYKTLQIYKDKNSRASVCCFSLLIYHIIGCFFITASFHYVYASLLLFFILFILSTSKK